MWLGVEVFQIGPGGGGGGGLGSRCGGRARRAIKSAISTVISQKSDQPLRTRLTFLPKFQFHPTLNTSYETVFLQFTFLSFK